MGRYSFFILSFCYRGHYVYADSSSSDVLLDSGSFIDVSGSGSTIDTESSTLDSSSSIQQEESTSASFSEESSEEGIQDSLDKNYEYYDLSNPFVFGNTNNGEDSAVDQNIMSRMFTTFASGGPNTVYAGPNNGWNITGYFTSWRLDGTLNATMIANNIDMIVNQARNSFSYVNSRLNGLENWRSSATSSITNLNSSVSSQRTQISNAFSRISTLESWKSGVDTNINNLFKDRDALKSDVANLKVSTANNINTINSVSSRVGTLESKLANTDIYLSAILNSMNTHKDQTTANFSSTFSYLTEINKKLEAENANSSALLKSMNTHKDQTTTNFSNVVSYLDEINKKNGNLITFSSALLTSMNTHKDQTTNNFATLSNYLDEINKKNANILTYQSALLTSMNDHKDQTTTNFTSVFNFLDDINKKMTNTNIYLSSMLTSMNTHKDQTKDAMSTIFSYFQDTNKKLDSNNDKLDINNTRMSTLITAVNLHKDQTTNNFATLWNYFGSLNSKMDKLISNTNSIGSIWSDVGIITAITGLHNTWKSKDYSSSVLEDDGNAVKLMKSVTTNINSNLSDVTSVINQLKSNIQAQFDMYFTDGGFFWQAYDKRFNQLESYFDMIYNMDNKDSMLYRLIYFFIDEMTKTRDFVIEINDNLLIANDSLLIIIDWLRMIYSKPPNDVSVVVPPFDFNRLQQMLDGLNFGNIVNEAGTNIWDFLSQLIKTLGEIISTAITGLTDVVGEILDLLGDLINQIIKLIVPENLDFLDTGFGTVKSKIDIKFGSFLSLGNQVKEVVQPIDQDFKKVVSIDIMGAKFNPDFSTIDWVVVRFRTVMALSIWMSVAIYIYRKITGNGDLINDN